MYLPAECFKPVSISGPEKDRPPHIIGVRKLKNGIESSVAYTAAQKQGLKYEQAVGAHLQESARSVGAVLWDHPWFGYNDNKVCQADFVMVFPSQNAILFEVKLTWRDCTKQLEFYSKILKHLGLSTIQCTVCKNLAADTPRAPLIYDFESIEHRSIWRLRV